APVPQASAPGRGSGARRIRPPRRSLRRAGGRRGARLMRLHRLRLVNFRQHADTEIAFGPGITGIVGPNGSGKTTLLEGMAWAIYGGQAARGDKESVRNLRAKPRSSVRVELEVGVGAHEYRVTRSLHDAELYQDGVLVANALKTVTEKLERALGMSHDEFFNTYFTGQKELAVMSALKPVERRIAEQAVITSRQEFQRLDKELAGALKAREDLKRLEPELVPIQALQQEREGLEGLQREEAARREELAKLEELRRAIAGLERRLGELGDPGERLTQAEAEVAAIEGRLAAAEAALETERTTWVRDRQD